MNSKHVRPSMRGHATLHSATKAGHTRFVVSTGYEKPQEKDSASGSRSRTVRTSAAPVARTVMGLWRIIGLLGPAGTLRKHVAAARVRSGRQANSSPAAPSPRGCGLGTRRANCLSEGKEITILRSLNRRPGAVFNPRRFPYCSGARHAGDLRKASRAPVLSPDRCGRRLARATSDRRAGAEPRGVR